MVPEKYGLAAIGRFLIEQFELRRPGLKEWTPEVERSLRQQAEDDLVQMERQLKEMGIDDPQYWQRVRGVLDDILVPRYARIAAGEVALAKREYGLWRGGDLLARGAVALLGAVLQIIALRLPIPVYEKWLPMLLLVGGPLFPDLAMWWYARRYRNKLRDLLIDLARANAGLDTYRPLSELTRSLEMHAEAPALPIEGNGQGRSRERS
jgi:hypothetical protein